MMLIHHKTWDFFLVIEMILTVIGMTIIDVADKDDNGDVSVP
jgi:hypothetical protein